MSSAATMPRLSEAVISGTIVVKVGAEEREYILHEAVLRHHSGYFRGALSGKFKETDDGAIPLEDVETDAFDVFVDWIYQSRLPECVYRTNPGPAVFDPNVEIRISVRNRAYVLADRLIAPGLQNALLEATYQNYAGKTQPSLGLVAYLFNNLPQSDVLLQLIIDVFCIKGGVSEARTSVPPAYLQQLPVAFLVGVMLKQQDLMGVVEGDWELRREDYPDKIEKTGADD